MVTLSYPTTITMGMNASIDTNGYPQVNFSYNDGYGWVTYDRATFTFADSLKKPPAFQISGFSYKPDNLPMDAEFIMGGPGGGSDTEDILSNISMELDYWNGYNYQAVSNAYDFGSNTAEGISNVSIVPISSSESGIPGVWAKSGSGILQMAYNTSTVGFLNLSSPTLSSGVIYAGTTSVLYKNGGANLTLESGTYYVHLVSGARKINFGNITVLPDAVTTITTVPTYWVNFTELGLPSGSSWAINVSGTTEYSAGNTISLLLKNGSYRYTVLSVPGYSAIYNSGELNISGASITVKVEFSLTKYEMHVIQSGLPSGILWYLNISQTIHNSSVGNMISFLLPNGTYLYNFSTPDSIYSGGSGSFRVDGSNVSITVDFLQNGHIVVISSLNSTLYLNGNRIADSKRNCSVY
ncbi:MAG: thermopsin family protease, partial [Thermoplasmataceae archaeon]